MLSYNTYVKDTIQLVRSLVIKSDQTIESINNFLTMAGHTISMDLADWKYYKNLNGEYYLGNGGVAGIDVPMVIKSLDTQADLVFSKANLDISPITRTEYSSYGKYYKELIAKYPDQTMLIKGIISPVDPTNAIAADDFTILHYDTRYVVSNETSLIPNLQQWIYRFASRWVNPSFAVTDSLYPAAALAILYASLPGVIINLRLDSCRTSEVHTFHLWSYLGGWFNIDRYKRAIPLAQALYLYRNIEYIVENSGRKSTLDMLYRDFASPFGLDMFSYTLNSDTSELLTNYNSSMYVGLHPKVNFTKEPYSLDSTKVLVEETVITTPDTVVGLLKDYTIGNSKDINKDLSNINASTSHNTRTRLPASVIECSPVVHPGKFIINHDIERMEQWFHAVSIGKLNTSFTINVPYSHGSVLNLSASDAVPLLLYCAAATQGFALTEIPTISVRGVLDDTITHADVVGGIEDKYRYVNRTIDGELVKYDVLTDVLADIVSTPDMYSIVDFTNYVRYVYNRKLRHVFSLGLIGDSIGKSQLQAIINSMYRGAETTISDIATYDELFTVLEFNPVNLTIEEFRSVAYNILNAMVISSGEKSIILSPQYEMVNILRELVSYTVQLVRSKTTSGLIPIDYPFLYPVGLVDVGMTDSNLLDTGLQGKMHVAHWVIDTPIFTPDDEHTVSTMMESVSTGDIIFGLDPTDVLDIVLESSIHIDAVNSYVPE